MWPKEAYRLRTQILGSMGVRGGPRKTRRRYVPDFRANSVGRRSQTAPQVSLKYEAEELGAEDDICELSRGASGNVKWKKEEMGKGKQKRRRSIKLGCHVHVQERRGSTCHTLSFLSTQRWCH